MELDNDGELGLREYLDIFRRRKGTVLLATLLVAVPALVLSFLKTPVYSASAELLIRGPNSESLFDPNSGIRNDPTRLVQNEIRIIESEPVRAVVREALGSVPKVVALPVGQTDFVRVTARDKDPGRAAEISNAFAKSYIDYRRKQSVDEFLAASEQLQAKVSDLQAQIDQAPTGPQKESLVQAQAVFKQKLDQAQVDSSLKRGGAELVTPAVASGSPVEPKPLRTGIIAIFLGGILGLALAFVSDLLDDSVKDKEDFERASGGLSVLALIPVVTAWKSRDTPMLITVDDPSSPSAESYRTLRTSIQFLGLERPMRILQVTSPRAKEGKSTTLANLGVVMARSGQRVAIVCCDLRRPRIHEFFGLDNSVGFTSVLLGKVPLTEALQIVPSEPRLALLASGPLPPNPSELLSSKRTVEVLASLQNDFDIVLLDCPPILPVTDALVLSGRVDATVLVAVAGATTLKEVSRTMELLRQVDAPLIGAVLNGADSKGTQGYDYYSSRDEKTVGGRQPAGK